MRGIDTNPLTASEMPSMTPGEASFALSVQESPLMQLDAAVKKMRLADSGPQLNPVQLNAKYPDMDQKFTEPMSDGQAGLMYDRFKVRREFQKAISLQPDTLREGFKSFAGSIVGSLVDPIGNAAGIAAGPALKGVGLVGETLVGKIGVGIADNFVANTAVDAAAATAGKSVGDEYNFKQRLLMNAGAATLFGTGIGALSHYFRASPKLGEKITGGGIEGRAAAGLDPESAKVIYDAHIAAENSGDHFQYEFAPFNQNAPMYSGSMHYTADFKLGNMAERADIGHERGVQLYDNENVAHAGALTAESGNAGAVFTHDIQKLNIMDGETKLSDINVEDANSVTQQALERHSFKGDASKAGIIETLVKALDQYNTGKFALESMSRVDNGMSKTVLGETLQNVGLYDAFRAFESFAEKARLPKSDLPHFTIHDAILEMDREIRNESNIKAKRALIEKYNAFKAAIKKDFNTPIADLGYKNLVETYHKLTDTNLVKYNDITVKDAYKEILRSYYAGQISLADVVKFENSIGADGIHFVADTYRGQGQTPHNGVYIFDRNNLTQSGVKPADPRAVGKLTPERLQSIQVDTNGSKKIFDYSFNEDKKLWQQVKAHEGVQLELTPEAAKVDETFNQAKSDLQAVDKFEGHLAPEDQKILDNAQTQFKKANSFEKIYNAIKSCLR